MIVIGHLVLALLSADMWVSENTEVFQLYLLKFKYNGFSKSRHDWLNILWALCAKYISLRAGKK